MKINEEGTKSTRLSPFQLERRNNGFSLLLQSIRCFLVQRVPVELLSEGAV